MNGFGLKPSGLEPCVPVGYAITTGKTKEDYAYIFEQLRKHANIGTDECLFATVSDQEQALLSALKESSIHSEKFTAVVLCELHLRENFENKMRKCDFTKEEISVRLLVY
ncbi:MAG: transposase [Gammaproteobacteria bacterium]|nr:transposase [Gammaproteobacteria bacterium]